MQKRKQMTRNRWGDCAGAWRRPWCAWVYRSLWSYLFCGPL